MCEEKRAIANLPKMLEQVPGIGVVLIGEGDLSQDLGYPRQYEHPTVASRDQRDAGDLQAIQRAVRPSACGCEERRELDRAGLPLADAGPVTSFAALEMGRRVSGRV